MSQRNSDNTIIKKTATASTRPSVGNVSAIARSSLDISNIVVNNQTVTIQPESLSYINVNTPGIAEANKAVVVNSSNNIENIEDISTNELYVNGTLVTGIVNRGATVSDSIYMNNIQPGVSSPEKILSSSPNGEITADVQSDIVKYNGGEIKGKKIISTKSTDHRDFVDIINFYVINTASTTTFDTSPRSNNFIYENVGDIMISNSRLMVSSHLLMIFQNPYASAGGSFAINRSPTTETHAYQCAYDPTFTRYMIPYITGTTTATLNIYVSPDTSPSTWTSGTAWTVVSLPNTTTGGSDILTPSIKWSSLLNQYVIFYANTLYGSTNGTTWTALSTTPATMGFTGKLIVHPNYLLVVNSTTTTYFTTNGTSWTSKVFASAPMTAITNFPVYLAELDTIRFNASNIITASTFLSLPSTGVTFSTVIHTGLNDITSNSLTYLSTPNCYVWNNIGYYYIYDIGRKILYTDVGSYYSGYINFGSFNTNTFANTKCWRYTINLDKALAITTESYVDMNPETFLNFENRNRAIIRDFEWVPAINKYIAIGFVDDAYNTAFYTNVCIYYSDDLETFTFVSDTGSTTVNKLCVNHTNGYLYIYAIGTATVFYVNNYGLSTVTSITNSITISGFYYISKISTVVVQQGAYIIVLAGDPTLPFNNTQLYLSYSGYGSSGTCLFNPNNLDITFNPGTLMVATNLITVITAITKAMNSSGATSGFTFQSGIRNGYPGTISLYSTTTANSETNASISYKRIASTFGTTLNMTNVTGSVVASVQYSNVEYIEPLGVFVSIYPSVSFTNANRIVYSYDMKTWIEPVSNSISASLINVKSPTVKYDPKSGYMYVLGSNGFFQTIHSMKKLNLEETILTKSQLSHFYARDNSGLELFPFSNIKSSDNSSVFNNGITYSKGVYVTCCTDKISIGSKIFNMVDTTLTGNWTAVASSLTHYIASGNGKIAISNDLGVNFSTVTTNISSYDWNFISYSDQVGRWAMCANNAFAFSTNGTTWTINEVTGGNWKSIKYSNGFWLAVGLNKIAYVNNASATTNGAFTVVNISGDWRDSAFGGQWIITGYGKTALSTNINSLVNWTTLTGANNKNFNSVVYVEGLRQFTMVGEHTAVYVQMTRTFFQPSNSILINTGESAWGVMKQCIWSDRYQAIICVGAGRSIVGSRIVGSGLDNAYFNTNSLLLSGYDNTLPNSFLNISDNPLSIVTNDGWITLRTNVLTKPIFSFKNNTDGLISTIDNKTTTVWGLTVPKCLSLEYFKYLKLGSTSLAYIPADLTYLSIDVLGTSTPNTFVTTNISGDIAAAGALNIGGLVLGNKIYSNSTPIIMQSVTNGVVSASKACKLDSSKNLSNVNVLSVDYLNIGVDTFECIPVDNTLSMYAHTQSSTECAENTALDACYHSDLDIYVAASNMTEFTTGTNIERNYLLFSKDGIKWNKCFTGLQANINKIIPLYADASKNCYFINTTTVTTYIGFVIFATNTVNNIGKIYFTPDLVNFYQLNTTGAATTHDTNYGNSSTIFFSDGSVSSTVVCNKNAASPNKFFRNIHSGSPNPYINTTTDTDIKYATTHSSNSNIFGLSGNDLFTLVYNSGVSKIALGETTYCMVYANALDGNSTNWDFIIGCASGKIIYNTSVMTSINGTAARTTLVIDASVIFTCCEYNFTSKRFLLGSNTGKIYISAPGSKTSWSLVTTPAWMNGSWVGIRSIGSKGFMIWHDDNGNNSKKNCKICRVDENNTFQLMYQSFERTLGVGCYGAGKYVVPEQSSVLANKIMYSDDGINWKYTFETSDSLNKVLYISHLNLFVAISNRSVFSSSDGINWTSIYTNSNGSAVYTSAVYAISRNLLVITYRNATTQNVVTSSDLSQWNTYDYTTYNNIYYSEYSPTLDRFIFSPLDNNTLPAFYTTNFTTTGTCVSTDTDSSLPQGRNIYWMQSSNMFWMGTPRWQSSDGISWKKMTGFLDYETGTFDSLSNAVRTFTYIPNIGDVTVSGVDPDGSFLVNVSNGMLKPIAVLGGGIKGNDYTNIIYNSDDNKVLVYKNTTGSRKGEYFQLVDLEEYKQKNNKEIPIDYIDKVYGDILSLDNYVGTSNIRTLTNSTLDGGLANKNAKLSQMGTWVSGAGSSASNQWNDICWSSSLELFVAVGSAGTSRVMTSTDGINWTGRTSAGESNSWYSVCWSPALTLFVAVAGTGTNRVMTSPDGITWTARTPSNDTNGWNCVCWSPDLNLFVAVAYSGTNRVMTSSNGTSWTARTSAVETNAWYSVCWSPSLSLFVAVANTGTAGRVMTSTDGTSWTTRISNGDSNSWNSVCWSPTLNLFVAVASAGTNRVMISRNGMNWDTIASANESNVWYQVHWCEFLRMFISVGSSGTNRIQTSSNGMNWNVVASPAETVQWYGSCSSTELNTVIGVGSANATNVMRLFEVKSTVAYTNHIAKNNSWNSICWAPSLNIFVGVAFGTGNLKVATSSDGLEWIGRSASNNTNTWVSVCWSPELSLFVAVANSGINRVMTSSNGITWTARTASSDTNGWNCVCWSPELTLFVAVATSGTNRVMTSPDGINWTARASATEANAWRSVCWSPQASLFVAVADTGTNRVMTSSNGTSWTARTSSTEANTWQSVCWSPTLNIFAAIANTGTNRAMTSTDGTTWTGRLTGNEQFTGSYFIMWSTELSMFIAPGSGFINTSVDGIYWFSRNWLYNGTSLSCAYSPTLGRLAVGSSTGANNGLRSIENLTNIYAAVNHSVSDNAPLYYVCWSPQLSLFVAITNSSTQRIITSPNANVWTARTPSSTTNTWSAVCWSPQTSRFVAVASAGTTRVMTSPDGTTWTGRTSSGESTAWQDVCWSPDLSLFVAVATSGTNRVMFSSNSGVNWTSTASSGESNSWQSVCWSPALGLFVAVASTGTNRVMTSTNGSSWTARTSSNESNTWFSVCWSPALTLFVAVATTGTNRVMTSPDGINWTARTPSVDTNEWRSVCWSPELGLFAAVAIGATASARRVMFSSDGINWTARVTSDDTQYFQSICWSPLLESFVAVTTGSYRVHVFTRPSIGNGTTPLINENCYGVSANQWQNVCWSPQLTLFAAVATGSGSNRVMTSKDGVNWTARLSAVETNSWVSICWSPELSLFVATAISGTNRVMTSSNGTSWIARTSSGESNTWQSICWSPELTLFVAVSDSGTNRVMTSPDGINWTARASAVEANTWYSVCWSSYLNLFVAVANSGTNRVMTSSNGTTWTARASATEANTWISVCWSPYLNLFAAVSNTGTNRVMTSPDGINWTARTANTDSISWVRIVWISDLNLFIATPNQVINNGIMISSDGITWYNRTYAVANSFRCVTWAPEINTLSLITTATSQVTNVYYVSPIPAMTLPYSVNWDIFWSKSLQRFIAYKKIDPLVNDTQIYLSKNGYSWTYDATSYTAINATNRLKAVTSYCEVPFLDAIYTCRNTAFVQSLTPIGVVETAVTGVPNANTLFYSNIIKCLIIGSSSSNLIAMCIPTKTGTILNIITYTLPATITVSQILTCYENHLIIPAGSTSSYYYSTNMNVFSTGTLPSTGVWKFASRNIRGYSKRVVGVNDLGVIIYSDNGTSWTTAVTYTVSTRSFINVKYIQEFDCFVAVDSISKTNAAIYSFDGITWSDITFASSVALCDLAYSPSNDNFAFLSTGSNLVTTIVTLPKSAAGGNIISYDTRTPSTALTNNIFSLNSKGGIYTGEFSSNTFNSAETENIPLIALHTNSAYKPTNSAWTIQSDIRIKHDIENADLDKCFDNVKGLDLKHYNWKEEFLSQTGETDRSRLGWIAQDVEKILPKSIIEMGSMYGLENLKTLNQDQIVATMYGAVQKLMQKYEALQRELD